MGCTGAVAVAAAAAVAVVVLLLLWGLTDLGSIGVETDLGSIGGEAVATAASVVVVRLRVRIGGIEGLGGAVVLHALLCIISPFFLHCFFKFVVVFFRTIPHCAPCRPSFFPI